MIYVSQVFFTHILDKSREKNLEIFGGHLAKIFCEGKLEIFLKIFVSQDLIFIIRFRKSRDFLSFFFCGPRFLCFYHYTITVKYIMIRLFNDNAHKKHCLLAAVAATYYYILTNKSYNKLICY